jgi:anti-sigma factor RsiW
MSEQQPLSDQERDDLVAYLDGELSEEEARALDAKLNLHPQARSEAEALRRTWELLDFLPRPEPSATFTHRTLERVVPLSGQALARSHQVRQRVRTGLFALGWAAALLLASVGGYAGYQVVNPPGPTEEDLVRDLRLIENKPLYDLVGDIEYLRALDDPSLFGVDDEGA